MSSPRPASSDLAASRRGGAGSGSVAAGTRPGGDGSDVVGPPGDVEAIYRAYGPLVLRWAKRLGGPTIDAEDVAQDVFVVAKRRLGAFVGPAKVTTWLFRVTEKVVQAARRKQRLRSWFSRSLDPSAAGVSLCSPTPGDVLDRQRDAAAVYRILDRLPDRQRRVLILFELEGLSTQAIADLIGVKAGTVRVWLFRARARFLEEHERLFRSGARGEPKDQTDRHSERPELGPRGARDGQDEQDEDDDQ